MARAKLVEGRPPVDVPERKSTRINPSGVPAASSNMSV